MMPEYYINGVSFDSLNVYVSASKGLLDKLKMKDPQKYSWDEYHGDFVDLSQIRYEGRDITLECFIPASNSLDFITKLNAFLAQFEGANTKRLMIVIDASKPMVYEVYSPDLAEIDKEWSDSTMAGTFSLKLREPEPVKRVIKFVASTGNMQVSVTLTSSKLINAYWGDASHTYDISGTSVVTTHTFQTAGTYYIILTGVIENITSLTTNGTIIWNKL